MVDPGQASFWGGEARINEEKNFVTSTNLYHFVSMHKFYTRYCPHLYTEYYKKDDHIFNGKYQFDYKRKKMID